MNIPMQNDLKALRYECTKISSPHAPVSANRSKVQSQYYEFRDKLTFGYDWFQRMEYSKMLMGNLSQLPVHK